MIGMVLSENNCSNWAKEPLMCYGPLIML